MNAGKFLLNRDMFISEGFPQGLFQCSMALKGAILTSAVS